MKLRIQLLSKAKLTVSNAKEKVCGLISKSKKKGVKERKIEIESLTEKYRNNLYSVNHCRDEEVAMIFDIFNKKYQHNVILTGTFGIGKNSIVESMAEKIVKNDCPEKFKNREIVVLSMDKLNPVIFSTEEILAEIHNINLYFSQRPDDILYIRNFNLAIKYGVVEYLKPMLCKVLTILTIDSEKYDKSFFDEDDFCIRNFEILDIMPAESDKLYEMLKGTIHRLSKFHNVRIKKHDVEDLIDILHLKNMDMILPVDLINSIDYAMGIAKNHGLKQINKKMIMEIYRAEIEDLLKAEQKKLEMIAYHEVGHCIIGLEHGFYNYGLQIIPNADSLGVNCFKLNEYGARTKSEYLSYIELMLGGIVATDFKGIERIDGGSQDIEKASQYARNMVLCYGMGEELPIGFALNDVINISYFSESMKEDLDRKTREILNTAMENAKKIISKNEKNIEILTKALIKKGFLTSKEVDVLVSGKCKIENIPNIRDLLL